MRESWGIKTKREDIIPRSECDTYLYFNKKFAEKYGLECAVLLEFFAYYFEGNANDGHELFEHDEETDGETLAYRGTLKEIHEANNWITAHDDVLLYMVWLKGFGMIEFEKKEGGNFTVRPGKNYQEWGDIAVLYKC